MCGMSYDNRSRNLNYSTRGRPNFETVTSTSYSEHGQFPEEYHDKAAEIQLVSRAMRPSDNPKFPNSYIALDCEYSRRQLPDPSMISGPAQRSGGSRSSGIQAHATRPPTTFYRKGAPSRDNSTWSNRDITSPINWPSPSETSTSFCQHPGRPGQFEDQFSFQGDTRDWGPDHESTIPFDRASTSSAQTSSSRTNASTLWSKLSVATSITSFGSGHLPAKAPKLDLEIPSHSLSMGAHLLSRNPKDATSKPPTIFNQRQGILEPTPETYFVKNNAPRHLHAGPSNQDQPTAEPSPDSIQNDPLQHLPQIEQAIRSPIPAFHTVNGVVASGTLEGLVQFLVTGFSLPGHTYYRDTFLTACCELTTGEDLFQILSRQFFEQQLPSDDSFGKQYTIFLIIIYWLKSNCFPPNEELLYRIKVFCKDAARLYPLLDSIANETWQLVDAIVVRPPAPLSNTKESILNASQIKPYDLAVGLALLEGDNYKALQPFDYLLHLSQDQSDGVTNYLETNEKIRLWTIRFILNYDTVSSRLEAIKFFISTALECHSMRNFSSTVAISRALHSVSIGNLEATRKALPKKVRAKLPTLSDIIDPQSNHRGYYDAMEAGATVAGSDICIPWLPVHLKELDKVVRQPLTVQVDGQHLVNFTRYNMFMDRTKKILHFSPPDLEDKRHEGQLTYLLNQLRHIDLSGDLES